jgi:hypothetical protein
MNRTRWFFLLIIAGGGCLLLIGLMFAFTIQSSNRSKPIFPQVTITSTFPEEFGVVDQPVVVFGQASSPEGIESSELWVNGALIAAQINSDQGPSPFETSQTWIPDGPGNYLFFLRGIDRKGYASTSSPVLIQVRERAYQNDPAMHGQYLTKAGDTIESIAVIFGSTPEEIQGLNPGIGALSPDESITVPTRPDTTSGGISPSPATVGGDEPPHVSAPLDPSLESGTPVHAAVAPWWATLPLPEAVNCLFAPALCAVPTSGDIPPLPATDVHASLLDACQASVSWTDNSETEAGYRIYRMVMRPHFRSEMLAQLVPVSGTGNRSTYTDATTPTGQFFYAVVVINEQGDENWGVPSEQITTSHLKNALSL